MVQQYVAALHHQLATATAIGIRLRDAGAYMLEHVHRERNTIADALTKKSLNCTTLYSTPMHIASFDKFTIHFDGSSTRTRSTCAWVCLGVVVAIVTFSVELPNWAVGAWDLPVGTTAIDSELAGFSSALEFISASAGGWLKQHVHSCIPPAVVTRRQQ